MAASWARGVDQLRTQRAPGVLVTLTSVRGHAPRAAGAKMVVSEEQIWDTIGGGNLEAVAIERARAMITADASVPQTVTLPLSDKAPYQHGVQCCGGEVSILLEPLAVVPAVAIFGVGHVGLELARILSRRDLDLHLVDSRPDQLSAQSLACLDDAVATVSAHQVPVLPELVLSELPYGTDIIVMTHDHAEDAALCDAALRICADDAGRLGRIGLIASTAKWTRFSTKLISEGHDRETIGRITAPIGIRALTGKDPATVALSVAAWLVSTWESGPHAGTEAPEGAEELAQGQTQSEVSR